MTPQDLKQERARCIRAIKQAIAPHLWVSSFRLGPIGKSKALGVWVPRNAQGQPNTERGFELNGYVVTTFQGVCDIGFITDLEGGGIQTVAFTDLPLEDLLKAEAWALKRFPAKTTPVTEPLAAEAA